MSPELAHAVAGFLSDDSVPYGFSAAVEFVAVPAEPLEATRRHAAENEGHSRNGTLATAAKPRLSRGGAGLEIDLADPRRPDAVPSDVRALLPRQGLANYLEALAVVHKLESLATDPDFLAEATHRDRRTPTCCRSTAMPEHTHAPVIAVIALYAAQVELLRILIHRSAILPMAAFTIEVGLPEAFRQRESLAALISLTRSHAHRAVTYGEGPQLLMVALTRACKHLVLFGDPGTLARRSQWNGPVDHLDEADSAHERGLLARILPYTQGASTRSAPARMREGSSV